jgi:hypothetical protein
MIDSPAGSGNHTDMRQVMNVAAKAKAPSPGTEDPRLR